jgi:hypothetical protein
MPLFGATDIQAAKPKNLDVGQVRAVAVTAGGTGYTDGAAATFSAAPGGGVTATGTVTVVGGVITRVNITNPGAGYVTAPTVSVAGGADATFAVKIAPIVYNNNEIFFVDQEEAQNLTNKSKGINGAGWWLIKQFTDALGAVRYKTECLVSMTRTALAAGDAADDLVVPDVVTTIAISVQPANQTTVTGGATFAVTAAFSAGTGTLTYQWQRKAAGSNRFVAVGGATSASLALTGQLEANDGDEYRVVIQGGGAKAVTSAPATLTFGD